MIGVSGSGPMPDCRHQRACHWPVHRAGHRRQGLNALMLEDVSGGDEQPCLARPANQLYRADAVAPKLKEVVLDPDPWEAKGLGKERAEDLFLGRARERASCP